MKNIIIFFVTFALLMGISVGQMVGQVTPTIQCVAPPGTLSVLQTGYVTAFGYNSSFSTNVTYVHGPLNSIFPFGPNRGQPTFFKPGSYQHIFCLEENDVNQIAWVILDSIVRWNVNLPICNAQIVSGCLTNYTGPVQNTSLSSTTTSSGITGSSVSSVGSLDWFFYILI